MERVRLLSTGWDSNLIHEIVEDLPAPGPGQVRIDIEACGVCYRDLIDRAGRFPFLRLPITPGHEAAGRVAAVGAGVTEFAVGDRVGTMHRDACGACTMCRRGQTSLCAGAAWVFGIIVDGGYASQLLAPAAALYRLPDGLSPASAAVLHCTFGTAYRDLRVLGQLRSGERLLVTGANGGVGAAAVQLGVRLGAEVVAVIRDERHRDFVRAQGAHQVIVAPNNRFHDHRELGSIDVALEAVGVSTFNSTLRSLAIGGRMVVVGNVVPEPAQVNLGYIVTKGLTVIGGSGATRTDMAELLALDRAKPLRIAIDRVLPLTAADEAQRRVRAGGLCGRVVLTTL